ncbi:MAG: PD40 domain-containing protein [Verrucomicrobia bacterium]|nr:PD40 domain-containing protein [Verrucomicrobiota bacterium]
MKTIIPAFSLILTLSASFAADIQDTKMLSQPAVSSSHIAFAYADDLWIANLDGSDVRRLTSHPGVESSPRFSPDGQWLAFTGVYEGNTDVYIVPVAGGVPKRLTWHPGPDEVVGFTPDGSAVLFTSPREVHTRRYVQFFTVPIEGGAVTRLPIPHGFKAAYSPDGAKILYLPSREAFRQWKHYRGGTNSRLLLFDAKTYAVEQIPQPPGRSNDTDPMWMGGAIYFISDRNGEFNLFSFNPETRAINQLTFHDDFPILSASAGGGRIVYEQAGHLHLFDPATRSRARLKIGVAADLNETRPRFVKGAKYIRNASVSPSGARAVFEFRGEIVTVPAEKGDDRNLTLTPAVHERSPAWSPDGKWIAFFSDERGEYELHIAPQDGKGPVRIVELAGAGFYEDLKWSPDSQKLSYSDHSRSIFIFDLAAEQETKISSDALYGRSALKTLHHAWSPDSKWLAYTRNTMTQMNTIYLYSVGERESHALTDGLANSYAPVFDADGKYLYFLASTDAGPTQDWFSMSNADMRSASSVYLVVLTKGVPSPLAKESDEEKEKKSEDAAASKEDERKKTDDKEAKAAPPKVTIEFEDLSQRIQALPVPAAGYSSLQAGKAGQIFYLKNPQGINRFGGATNSLQRFDLEKKKEEAILENVDAFTISADRKKVLLRIKESWSISDLGDKVDPAKHKLAIDKLQVKIDPRAEWSQIFEEAWRINRDYFYDPHMHGADWKAMKAKYAPFLPHLAVRSDLNRLLQWMCSELAVGHHSVFGGDRLYEPEFVPGGLLGADYSVENGRYRFKKVYGGLNWNPELRSPLTEPGVDVKAGEYLVAVQGKDLRFPENLYSRFEAASGRIVEITVGPNADGAGSRIVKVVPIADETALRNRDWVEGNLRRVSAATGGRVAYVYVPNTTTLGHEYFKRYFFPQADREAIIVDERYNGGGQVADYYIDILRRPYISHWAMRYGADLKTPSASIQGPKVMLIDQDAGSGGDLLPWMFKKLELGLLIGKCTWGGLVGILGFPVLMDGGFITAPNLAIWTEDGFIVENVGVPPDIEVEQAPAEVIAGRDPQLEKAIEVVLKQLEAKPPASPKRPPFPVRVRR